IVGGSGLFKPIRDRKELSDSAKAGMIAKNQAALTEAVEKATGKKMDFIDVRKEVELMIDGLVRKKHLSTAVLIDAGTSATRGGYRHPGGLYVTFEAPGAGGFEAKVKEKMEADAKSRPLIPAPNPFPGRKPPPTKAGAKKPEPKPPEPRKPEPFPAVAA